MRTEVKSRLAPGRGWDREPIGNGKRLHTINGNYTTAIIGGKQAGAVAGWEAITPKPQTKPQYLTRASQNKAQAWDEYLWHIDQEADQGTIEALWEAYERAERTYNRAYEAHCQGLDFIPCDF